jgi:O-antigen/teichoic acid export membrane protein
VRSGWFENTMTGSATEAARRRSRALRLAVVASAISKATAFGLQVLSLPLVFKSLPTHEYAIFVLVSAGLATLSITQLGAGPGLTQHIANADASNDRERQATSFASTLSLSLLITSAAGAVLLVLVRAVPAETLFGPSYADDHRAIVDISLVCVLVMCAHIFLGNVDAALAGYQEQYLTAVASSIANVVSTIALVVVCVERATIVAVILAIYLPQAGGRLANFCVLLWRRSYLARGFATVTPSSVRAVLADGLGFWLFSLSSVVEQNAGTFILSRFSTSAELSAFYVVFRLVWLCSAGMGIITQPLWPAYVDARARRDFEWIRSVAARTLRLLMCAALVLSVCMVVTFPWFRDHLDPASFELVALFAVYLIANTWTHYYYVSLMGLCDIWRLSYVAVAENAIMVALGIVAAAVAGAEGVAAAYLLASLALPGWYLPVKFRRTMRSFTEEPAR